MMLETRFDGLVFENPLLPASGPLNGDFDKLRFLQDQGLGGIVTKTISIHEPKIPKPCIYGGKDIIQNSELWSEHSLDCWVNDFLPAFWKIKNRPLIVSVGYTQEDMAILIPALDPFADAFEVSTHYVGTDLSRIGNIVKTIRQLTKKPIYMKISPHLPDPEGFARTITRAGASGIVAINSVGPTLRMDLASRQIIYSNDQGFVWMSGPAIKPIALATIHRLKQAVPELTIIGVGGIRNACDVLEFLLAGASAVQLLSAALLYGKDLYKKIIQSLPSELEKYHFSNIMEVIQTPLTQQVYYQAPCPILLEEKCTRCRLCERICPYFAIEMRDKITFDPDLCSRCGLCVSKCPTGAIQMDIKEMNE